MGGRRRSIKRKNEGFWEGWGGLLIPPAFFMMGVYDLFLSAIVCGGVALGWIRFFWMWINERDIDY